LKSGGKRVDDSGELAEAEHFGSRNVADMACAEEGQHVVFAQTVYGNVAHYYLII